MYKIMLIITFNAEGTNHPITHSKSKIPQQITPKFIEFSPFHSRSKVLL